MTTDSQLAPLVCFLARRGGGGGEGEAGGVLRVWITFDNTVTVSKGLLWGPKGLLWRPGGVSPTLLSSVTSISISMYEMLYTEISITTVNSKIQIEPQFSW